ncbi:MAG: ABC transporter permease [Verrucomicrobia bacterium]|nr:ABC transporter permease [Verrucomicrobiota bacterium]
MWFLRQFLLAWRMLSDRPARLTLSFVGVAFAVVIMFAELGFLNGVTDSSINLAVRLGSDLVVVHPQQEHLKSGVEFPLFHLQQVRDVPGVAAARPLYTSGNYWANPQDGSRNRVLVIGVDLDDPMLRIPELATLREELRAPDTVLFDRRARLELGVVQPGTRSRVAGHPVRVAGLFSLGPNFAYEGHVLMSSRNFLRLPNQRAEDVDLGMVRLQPGADPETVRRRIQERVGARLEVLTAAEVALRERTITTRKAPVGIVFGLGLLVGFAIGTVVCYQILFNEVNDHLPQFAMLKALGHPPRFLIVLVLFDALILSLGGFLAGWLVGRGLYAFLERQTALEMDLSTPRALLVLALTSGMCLLAGWLALKRVAASDPADLF